MLVKVEPKARCRLEKLAGNYIVFDGTHRAKAYDLLGLPVTAKIKQPPWYAEWHMLEEIFRLKKISELKIISNLERYLEAKEISFYR